MLCPKHTRFRKFQKGKNPLNKISKSSDILQFGRYGLKVLSGGFLKSNTIEAVRRVLTRKLKRNGQIWIRVFPDKARSQKPLATRMGKGKGAPSYWYVPVYAGQIIFEIDGVALPVARQSALDAAGKLPIRAVFIKG